ncbi:MAG: hypothetical protein FWE33_06225 [Defluviitaleaceae bacterium]|nr:hypothetical protein [Defluviitaleaceae bacterium]
MEKILSPSSEVDRNDSRGYCEKFDKIAYPMSIFNPPQKDEYLKRICDKKCQECPFFAWLRPGSPGRNGKDGKDGLNGKDGKDGTTPHIGINGNWWIGKIDTGITAKGKDGANGINGTDGINGINGINGTNGIDGKDGITPHIGANDNWFIGDVDTGILARGDRGKDGSTPYIGINGNWWIDYEDTGVKASGKNTQEMPVYNASQEALVPSEGLTQYDINMQIKARILQNEFKLYVEARGGSDITLSIPANTTIPAAFNITRHNGIEGGNYPDYTYTIPRDSYYRIKYRMMIQTDVVVKTAVVRNGVIIPITSFEPSVLTGIYEGETVDRFVAGTQIGVIIYGANTAGIINYSPVASSYICIHQI